MVDWCGHLIDHSGKFIALKGVFPSEELESLPTGVKFEQKIALEVEQEDSVTARYSRNEIIDEKEVYLYSEDKIVDYFYNYADNINSWSGQLLISSINISEEKENDLGFLEMSIEVNAQVSDITVMKAFLDYLIAKDSKYQFFIENYYHPLDGREGNFNMKLPLKVFYR